MKTSPLFGFLPRWLLFAAAFLVAVSVHAQSGPPTDNLQLWLKADAGVTHDSTNGVSKWADQSGNGHDAVVPAGAGAPVSIASDSGLGGKPSIQFNTGQFMQLTNSLDVTGDLSTFVVVRLHSQASNYRGIWDQAPVTGPAYPYPDQYLIYNNGLPTLQRGNGPSGQYDDAFASSVAPLTNYVALGLVTSGIDVNFFKNNDPDGHDIIAASVSPAGSGIPIRIGARYPSGNYLNGEIAELLIYDASLTDQDRTNLWTYLANKYVLAHSVDVSLSSNPTNGATISPGSTVLASATVSILGASVSKVDFQSQGITIASVTAPPYIVPIVALTPGILNLTAQVTDSLGVKTLSAPVHINVSGNATFTPDSSLELWLEAGAGIVTNASGQVTQWNDQSGNANNAVQGGAGNAPTLTNGINGKPSVHFNGADTEYMEIANSASLAITGDIAGAAVIKVPASQFSDYRMIFYQGGSLGYPSPNGLMLVPGGDPAVNRGTGTTMTQDLTVAPNALPDNQFALVTFNQAGTNVSQTLDGVANGTGGATVTPVDSEMGSTFLGTRGDLYSVLTYDVAELMIFDKSITGSALTNLQSYFSQKYGLAFAVQGPNTPPAVSLSNPLNGSSFSAPASLTVTATASDSDGAVSKVELFANGMSYGVLTAPPYEWPLTIATPAAVTFTVVATDNLGATNAASVSLAVTGQTNVEYNPGTNLVLWLKADAGVTTNASGGVVGWTDQSSYGNNASAPSDGNAPTFLPDAVNGHPSLHFDLGLTAYLTVPHSSSLAITNDIASFVVFSPSPNNSSNFRFLWFMGGSYPSPNGFMMFPGNVLTPCRGDETNGLQDLFTADISPTPNVYSVVGFSEQGSTMRQYINGLDNGQPQTSSTAPVDHGSPLYIGSRGDLYSYLRSDVAEIMIFNSALAGANLDAVRNYLGTKYGIPSIAFGLANPGAPSLTAVKQGNGSLTISWPASFSGYILESASAIPSTSWSPVSGVVNNQAMITPNGQQQFYRLRHP